jgi:hypothetical protein
MWPSAETDSCQKWLVTNQLSFYRIPFFIAIPYSLGVYVKTDYQAIALNLSPCKTVPSTPDKHTAATDGRIMQCLGASRRWGCFRYHGRSSSRKKCSTQT